MIVSSRRVICVLHAVSHRVLAVDRVHFEKLRDMQSGTKLVTTCSTCSFSSQFDHNHLPIQTFIWSLHLYGTKLKGL